MAVKKIKEATHWTYNGSEITDIKQYKEFLDQRTFHKESFVNVADLREDLQGFITLCRDRQNK